MSELPTLRFFFIFKVTLQLRYFEVLEILKRLRSLTNELPSHSIATSKDAKLKTYEHIKQLDGTYHKLPLSSAYSVLRLVWHLKKSL